jgi:hypothetical protein
VSDYLRPQCERDAHPGTLRRSDVGVRGLSTMYPGGVLAIPTSVYSVPLVLAEQVGGWDGDATAIGEDMHMLSKCYFETGGAMQSRVIYSPASQCNISSSAALIGWRHTLNIGVARYRQALRHMWGSLDTGYAIRKSVSGLQNSALFASHRRQQCFFLSSFPRTSRLTLLYFLWEAHFLPVHVTIILLFSLIYPFYKPISAIHSTVAWVLCHRPAPRLLVHLDVCLHQLVWPLP